MKLTEAQVVATALDKLAHQVCLLGNAGAVPMGCREMGAIEYLSMQVRDGSQAIAGGLHAIAEAIADSRVADIYGEEE